MPLFGNNPKADYTAPLSRFSDGGVALLRHLNCCVVRSGLDTLKRELGAWSGDK